MLQFAKPRWPCLAVAWTAFALTSRALAVIQVITPLQKFMDDAHQIVVMHVERVDPSKPGLVLVADRALKGKIEFERLAINLTGDAESDKAMQTPELLKRVAPDLPLIAFIQKQQDGSLMMLAFTNGTWFQVLGQSDGKDVRWAYTHCEIYLRRTYKGTTAEMEQTLVAALAKKKRPPAPSPKEPPGLGPAVEAGGKSPG